MARAPRRARRRRAAGAAGRAGFGVLRSGPPVARLPSAAWLSLVGLAVGLSNGHAFLHPIVLAVIPGDPARALATVAIATGVAGTAAGCLVYARSERG